MFMIVYSSIYIFAFCSFLRFATVMTFSVTYQWDPRQQNYRVVYIFGESFNLWMVSMHPACPLHVGRHNERIEDLGDASIPCASSILCQTE